MSRITPSTLDRRLTDALRGGRAQAPMPDGLLRVPDRWVRRRRSPRSSGQAVAVAGVVTLAAVTTLAILAFVGALGEPAPSVGTEDTQADAGVPIQDLDTEPRVVPVPVGGAPAIGPVVEVARGHARGAGPFSYTVYRAEAPSDLGLGGLCLFFQSPGGGGGGCGAMPGEDGTIGEVFGMTGESLSPASRGVQELSGIVALGVAEVWIETDAGTRAKAILLPLEAAEIAAQLFIVFLPYGVDSTAWVALDADGTEIGRIPDGPRLPEHPGATPIPADAPVWRPGGSLLPGVAAPFRS